MAAPWSLNINSLHLPNLPPDQSGSVREDEADEQGGDIEDEGEQVGDIEDDDEDDDEGEQGGDIEEDEDG